jgi:hypothetical protein
VVQPRLFTDDSIAGTVLEMGNAAPEDGFNSMFTLLPAGTPLTLKTISTSLPGCSEVTSLLPIVAVNMLVESLVPRLRITVSDPGAKKPISSRLRSMSAGACCARPIVKVIISIPTCGFVDIPYTFPFNWMFAADCSVFEAAEPVVGDTEGRCDTVAEGVGVAGIVPPGPVGVEVHPKTITRETRTSETQKVLMNISNLDILRHLVLIIDSFLPVKSFSSSPLLSTTDQAAIMAWKNLCGAHISIFWSRKYQYQHN